MGVIPTLSSEGPAITPALTAFKPVPVGVATGEIGVGRSTAAAAALLLGTGAAIRAGDVAEGGTILPLQAEAPSASVIIIDERNNMLRALLGFVGIRQNPIWIACFYHTAKRPAIMCWHRIGE